MAPGDFSGRRVIIGIDLGTTNCAVGVWRDGETHLIPNSLGHLLTPSAVSLDEASGELLVGLPARERLSTHPRLTAAAFKRYMGSARKTRLGKKEYLPEELSALVLSRLKADAEAFLGQPVTEAVITVPAYFNDKQRKATRRAGELAGLKVERLLNEPTAAALAYGIHQLADETRFLVFDLGGGTFDVSVLEIFEGVIEVRASTGDNRLGGEDFNSVIADAFYHQHKKALERHAEDPLLVQKVRVAAEKARRALTGAPEAVMSVTWKDKAYDWTLTTAEFETLAAPLIERLRQPVLRSLRDSQLASDDLAEIVLVGGSTRMPLVRNAVTRMFGRFPSHAVNPDEAVARGAAVQAGLKARDTDLKEVVLTDVCPHTLGVGIGEKDERGRVRTGIFAPIIERNTVVPVSRVETYFPMDDGQRQLQLEVFQGESRNTSDNVRLGEIVVPIRPGPSHENPVDVRFTYDINGILEVDVHVRQTDDRHELVIVDEDTLSAADLAERRRVLAALKQHPRDADANKAALARAERCYEEALGDDRHYVSSLLSQFHSVLDRQDVRESDEARAALLAALDKFEGATWL